MSSYEEIRPRELKPALLELDGISLASIEAHYKLYQGYVNKRNEILGSSRPPTRRCEPDLFRLPRAQGRSLFAVGGIKTTRSTSSTWRRRRRSDGAVADLIKRDFGSSRWLARD